MAAANRISATTLTTPSDREIAMRGLTLRAGASQSFDRLAGHLRAMA